jgi:hypothetical protein
MKNNRSFRLKKYDAPLRIQYTWGYEAFKSGGKFFKVKGKQVFQEHRPNIDPNTMQYREWMRGWNDAYFGKPMAYELQEEKRNGFRGRS